MLVFDILQVAHNVLAVNLTEHDREQNGKVLLIGRVKLALFYFILLSSLLTFTKGVIQMLVKGITPKYSNSCFQMGILGLVLVISACG